MRILVVEDEEKVSRFIVRGLLAERFAVDAAKDGNAGRVLSRTMIIEHVWDQSFDGATNIVDVYVKHLRNKVDDPYDTKLIRTVRGVGYSISSESDE
jgi:DNA-binding response OmpR family regulator